MLFFKALKNKYNYINICYYNCLKIITYEHRMEIHMSKLIYDGFLKGYPTDIQILRLNCKKL